ncbi:sodium/hydrogen exchanger 10-like [Tribolium madens]|uniref:sodium/hydrogen exchanger 10-like n=1 Tax=Tribolium madens TaxID=41895 RepID=UPI001CF73DA1|nr:sodium/hydrogen exchanger 10-like [Tribolium madens]
MKSVLILILILLIYVGGQPTDIENFHMEERTNSMKYLHIFSVILLVTIAYEIPIPHGVFVFFLGIFWGVGMKFSFWMYNLGVEFYFVIPLFKEVYLPVLLFSTAFCLDVHSFVRSLTQVLIISFPVSVLSTLLCGLVAQMVVDPKNWKVTDGIFLGFVNSAIYPVDVLRYLQENTIQNKYVTSLLQGETLFSTILPWFIYQLTLLHMFSLVVYWYQFVMGFVRLIIGGLFLGYVLGFFCVFLMKFSYNDPSYLMVLTVAACYSNYYIGEYILSNAGALTLIISAVMMAYERQSLSKEVEESVVNLWKMICYLMTSVIIFLTGSALPEMIGTTFNYKDYIFVLVTYLLWNITRFISFFLFSPILSRIGYGMTFSNMIIYVWAGLKNPVCISYSALATEMTRNKAIFLHTVGVYFLMLLINGSFTMCVLRVLGLAEISTSRRINMNNCMKYLYEARSRTVAILKMDRFLSDANWPLVMTTTTLKHPYKKSKTAENEDEDENDEGFSLGYKYTFCPDCEKDIPNEPTSKELKEMLKEAKLRILKLKKTIYARQFESGMISKEGLRILQQAVEIAMDSDELVIELDGLYKLFTKERAFYRFLRNRVQAVLKSRSEDYKAPRVKWKLWCYHFIETTFFKTSIYIVIVINISLLITSFALRSKTLIMVYYIKFGLAILFFIIYLVIFGIKLCAYSWSHKITHTLSTYFGYQHNLTEYVILCFTFATLLCYFFKLLFHFTSVCIYLEILLVICLIFRLLTLLKFLRVIKFFKTLPNTMIKVLDSKVDSHRAMAFEMAKNYVVAEEEILEILHQIIDNEKIRLIIKEKMQEDRLAIVKRISMFVKHGGWLVPTVKTKAALRAVINSMIDDLHELKISGWVDEVEYNKLFKSLGERSKYVNSIKSIAPTLPRKIFEEVPYIGDDCELINFLYNNIATKKFDPGDVIVSEEDITEGIYIVVTGMFLVTYTPNEDVIATLKMTGLLPGIDAISSLDYEEALFEYIIPGNTMGELSTITERPYSGVVTAETHSQVYVLNQDVVKKAIEMDTDPVTGLACRIWKYISFRKAITIMLNVPSYRSYTLEKIKYILERSFVPDLSNYKIFVVNEMMSDIILIEGSVVDFNTRDLYIAPCYIPRTVQKLVMPKSSLINVEVRIETKLLVIPAKDYDGYDIMLTEEETCELVSDNASKCLRHFIKQKAKIGGKASKYHSYMGSSSRSLKKRLQAVASTKISFASTQEHSISFGSSHV